MITGSDLKTAVLVVAGNIFIVILVIRSLGSYAKKEWGELIGQLLIAVVLAGLIYANDTTMTLIKSVWALFIR